MCSQFGWFTLTQVSSAGSSAVPDFDLVCPNIKLVASKKDEISESLYME
jgi:hypothetical protein